MYFFVSVIAVQFKEAGDWFHRWSWVIDKPRFTVAQRRSRAHAAVNESVEKGGELWDKPVKGIGSATASRDGPTWLADTSGRPKVRRCSSSFFETSSLSTTGFP